MFSFLLRFNQRVFKRIGATALVGLLGFLLTVQFADAKRLGGGHSIGRQSSMMHHQYKPSPRPASQPQHASHNASPSSTTPPVQQQRNRWLGPIAGLAAGLGIAALMSHLGFGGALGGMFSNLIIIGLVILAVYWAIRLFQRNRMSATTTNAPGMTEPAFRSAIPAMPVISPNTVLKADDPQPSNLSPNIPAPSSISSGLSDSSDLSSSNGALTPQPGVPSDFDIVDTVAFLRTAKVLFIRLQAAWDAVNLNDIHEFTTPEMFAEIKLDLIGSGNASNRTNVPQLNAELIGVENRDNTCHASVRFFGQIEENAEKGPQPFIEIWNLVKCKEGKDAKESWLLAGIQQVASV